ncbi:MAG: hypothetical protein ACI9FJ_001420 [Alteromonadaceae bacterium]|jgi:uncharacterized protein YigA (DUF484 family)
MNDVEPQNDELMIDEQLVKEYLLDHPQFFIQNPEVVQGIRLHHQERGVISLVERQQELQRAKIHQLEEEITQLMGVARQNEAIFLAFSDLYLQLIKSTDATTLYQAMVNIISKQLSLPSIYLKRFSDEEDQAPFHIQRNKLSDLLEHRLQRSDYYFGRLTLAEQHQLFSNDSDIKSAALMLLGENGEIGFVAFGSTDENHFFPGMDILFLKELRKILGLMLERF